MFDLSFFHADYPAGVQDKEYRLQTLFRSERFMVSISRDHTPGRVVILQEISRELIQKRYPGMNIPDNIDIQSWLDREMQKG